MDTKFCHNCQTEKSVSDFHANRIKKDGLSTQCKACSLIRTKKWAANNKEKVKAAYTKYRAANLEKTAAACKKWRQNNPEKVAALSREWRAKNPDKVREVNLKQRKKGNKYREAYKKKFPLKFKARTAVHNAVFLGKMPKITTLQCSVCANPAEQYHHHKGYEKEYWLDVVPVCRKCHVAADMVMGSYSKKS